LISEAAFSVDESISFNITSNLGSQKKKAFQRQDMVKHMREKRLGVREQFETEHEDAGIGTSTYNYQSDRDHQAEYFNLDGLLKKSKFNRIGGKYGGYLPKHNYKKGSKSTFGSVRRFAPEPGSVHSKSQQRVLHQKKKGPTSSSANIQMCNNLDSGRQEIEM
jgi:hypothetical protein